MLLNYEYLITYFIRFLSDFKWTSYYIIAVFCYINTNTNLTMRKIARWVFIIPSQISKICITDIRLTALEISFLNKQFWPDLILHSPSSNGKICRQFWEYFPQWTVWLILAIDWIINQILNICPRFQQKIYYIFFWRKPVLLTAMFI